MSQLAPEPKSAFVGAHVAEATRDQLRARALEEDRTVSALIRRALLRELERTDETRESA